MDHYGSVSISCGIVISKYDTRCGDLICNSAHGVGLYKQTQIWTLRLPRYKHKWAGSPNHDTNSSDDIVDVGRGDVIIENNTNDNDGGAVVFKGCWQPQHC